MGETLTEGQLIKWLKSKQEKVTTAQASYQRLDSSSRSSTGGHAQYNYEKMENNRRKKLSP